MAKIQPSVLNLEYKLAENTSGIIDISQSVSIVSRRFYRQGLNWVVGGFTLQATMPSPNSGTVTISKVPSTWIASNAWHKVYANWKRQQDEAIAESTSQSAVAKYRDFKIHANADHVTAGFGANLIPVDLDGNPYLTGEWDSSQIVVPNYGAPGVNYEPLLHMVGADLPGAGGSISMINAYQNSRSVPQSPDPSVPPLVTSNVNYLNMMFDVGDNIEDVMDNVILKNDDLPYDQDEYPGSSNNAPTLERVHRTTMIPGFGTTSRQLPGTTVPCGLLVVDNSDSPVELRFIIHLVPGPAKGYLTQPMQDM